MRATGCLQIALGASFSTRWIELMQRKVTKDHGRWNSKSCNGASDGRHNAPVPVGRLALDFGDAAFADFEQGVAAGHKTEVNVGHQFAVHPYRALSDQPARLAGGGDKLQLFH